MKQKHEWGMRDLIYALLLILAASGIYIAKKKHDKNKKKDAKEESTNESVIFDTSKNSEIANEFISAINML